MLVWIVSFSMGFLLLLIVVGTVMLMVGITIGVQYQCRKGPLPSVPAESSQNNEMDLKTSNAAAPVYEEVTLVGGIELSHNVAYGHILLK